MSVTQGWSKVRAGGVGRRAGQPSLSLTFSCRASMAFAAEAPWCHRKPLLSGAGLISSHPLPQVPSCQRWVYGEGEKRRTFPRMNSGAGGRCPHPASLRQPLSGSTHSTGLWVGLLGQGPAGASSVRPPGLASGCPGWGQGVPGGLGMPASTALGPWLGVTHQHICGLISFYQHPQHMWGSWGTDPTHVSCVFTLAQSLAHSGRGSMNTQMRR